MTHEDPLEQHREEIMQEATGAGQAALPARRPRPGPTTEAWWRRGSTWAGVAVALVVAALLTLGWVAIDARSTAQDANDSAVANGDAVREANRRILSLGGTPVPTPSAGQPGATGARGPAPTDGQVKSALTVVCQTSTVCVAPVKLSTVQALVRDVCPTRAACTGPRGPSGSPGASGASGISGPSGAAGPSGAPGGDGPGPSDDQIGSALVSYCASRNGCAGPVGPTGPRGETGESGAAGASGSPGRGIASINCSGLGVDRLRITYDDGTTQDVACDLNPPTDSSTPTPTDSSTPSETETP